MSALLALLVAPAIRLSTAQTWTAAFCTEGELPGVGDADGDGRADLIGMGDGVGGTAFLQRTSTIGKAFPVGVMRNVGAGTVAVWGVKGAMLALLKDGTLLRMSGVVHDSFTKREVVGRIDASLVPPSPVQVAVAPDGIRALLTGPGEKALLLRVGPSLEASRLSFPGEARDAAWARFTAPAGEAIVWRGADGFVQTASLVMKPKLTLGPSRRLGKAGADERMAVGRFSGGPTSDLIVGRSLWPGGKSAKAIPFDTLPTPKDAKTDMRWFVGDIDGNGRDDLIRLTRSGQPWSGNDTVVHFASLSTDVSAGYVKSASDGLLDDWKEGRIKPGGLNLKALGAKVGRRELVVEFERREDVSDSLMQGIVERSRRFFAEMPVFNPDGSKGIHLLAVVRPPTSRKDHGDRMARFDDYFPAPEKRGVVHTFYVEPDGPLVAGIWGTNGHTNQSWHAFVHEIGHNFGLGHEGPWGQSYNALYSSLMSYAYSYSLNDDGEQVRYSAGEITGTYSERALPERMPFPIGKMKHVGYGPYRFRMKADGDQTLVDWNWNGVFEEKPVVADITYSHGIRIGARYDADPSWCGPALTAVGDRLVLFSGLFPAGTPVPDPRAPNAQANLTRSRPGALVVQTWKGDWAARATVEEKEFWGSPSAVTVGNRVFVGYATTAGPVVREVRLAEDGQATMGKPFNIPAGPSAIPTLAAVDGRIAVLLWANTQSEVSVRWLNPDGPLSSERNLGIRSRVPVGATGGRSGRLWVARIEDTEPLNKGRTELVGFEIDEDRGALKLDKRSWLDGGYATVRPTLLWRNEPGLDGEGRVYHLSGSVTSEAKPWAEQYLTFQTAKPGSGWQFRRYYDSDYASRDAPGACWFRDDMAYVLRLSDPNPARNDKLSIGFYGTGATPEPIGDFNDVWHIKDYGLARSIMYAHR
ncbi:MAG: hypothetical protein ACO1SV_10975 [Fimbriimonas sp.]